MTRPSTLSSWGSSSQLAESDPTDLAATPQPITDAYMQEMLGKTRPYTVIILRKTPKFSEPGVDKIVREHGRRNFELRRDGKLCVTCAFRDGERKRCRHFRTNPEETRRTYDDDPGVKAGILSTKFIQHEVFPVILFQSEIWIEV